LEIGWVDFSKGQRDKVLSVINLLSEQGAVDELGVGVIRDSFANIFFPGTSTIQTRAKYFLLTGYILSGLERDSGMTPERMINRLHAKELDLIEVLKRDGEMGVIGGAAGKRLKRKPSEIYWSGIRTYGIFTGGKMSLYDYARVVCLLKGRQQNIKSLGATREKDDRNDADDADAVESDISGGFWRLPRFNWEENLSINLTFGEAIFLKERIISSVPGSFLAWVLKNNYTQFLGFQSFDQLAGIRNLLPEDIASDCLMAIEFADFAYGMHLRYNVMLSREKDDEAVQKWEAWRHEMEQYARLDLSNILFKRLNINNGPLIKFLFDCKNAMLEKDIQKLDKIILNREKSLKGEKRSKLYNASEFDYEGWVGIGKLQYRLPNAQNIVADIFKGLGDSHV
jgi:hypothetical protein